MEQNFTPTPEKTNDKHRDKTAGEHLFNLTTYGGLALIGNEVTATVIVDQKDKANVVGRAFRASDAFFKKIGPEGKFPYLQNRMNYINFAILGGFTMVPLIKLLEDHKGPLVRFADGVVHGKTRNSEPDMVQAHEEMDDAPHQSWGSLMKGRVATVAAAYAIDSTVGWDGGMLARAAKGTKFEKYASFDHLSNMAADKVSSKYSSVMKHSLQDTHATQAFMRKGAGLLSLSTALTLLFYGTSKLFASRRDQRLEKREQDTQPVLVPRADNNNEETPPVIARNDNEPTRRVNHIEAGTRVVDPSRLQGVQV
jgi:hypothetical protein